MRNNAKIRESWDKMLILDDSVKILNFEEVFIKSKVIKEYHLTKPIS